MMNSVPARWASTSSAHIRATTLLARSSSARCLDGMKRHPMISMRVRTGGGPPSGEVADLKNLEMEKVLHGGAAMGVLTSDDAFAQLVVHGVLGDVSGVTTSRVGVTVEQVNLEAEAARELSQAVGPMIRA